MSESCVRRSLESRQPLRILRHRLGKDLDRHITPQLGGDSEMGKGGADHDLDLYLVCKELRQLLTPIENHMQLYGS